RPFISDLSERAGGLASHSQIVVAKKSHQSVDRLFVAGEPCRSRRGDTYLHVGITHGFTNTRQSFPRSDPIQRENNPGASVGRLSFAQECSQCFHRSRALVNKCICRTVSHEWAWI